MAIIGIDTDSDTLVLWRGRDFKWTFENLDPTGASIDYPAGDLYFEIYAGGEEPDEWHFTIVDSTATLKVESTAVDAVPNRSLWQLVFLPEGETAGGDPVARGRVSRVGD